MAADIIETALSVIVRIGEAAATAKANGRTCKELADRWKRLEGAIRSSRFCVSRLVTPYPSRLTLDTHAAETTSLVLLRPPHF